MNEAIKVRTQTQGEITDIRILMPHPMETGLRKDDKGQTLAAHFIQSFTVSLNGKAIIEGQLNTSVSRNPLFAFKARGVKSGDKLGIAWIDNLGEKRRDEFSIP